MFRSTVNGMLVIVAPATVVGLLLCRTLRSHPHEIASTVMSPAASNNPQFHIPVEVLAPAARHGVRTDTPPCSMIFNHSRHTGMKLGDKPMKFASRKTASIVLC